MTDRQRNALRRFLRSHFIVRGVYPYGDFEPNEELVEKAIQAIESIVWMPLPDPPERVREKE